MKPINYAILKYVAGVEKASPSQIVDALKSEYGSHRMLREKKVLEALMTAEKNGLLEISDYELDDNGNLVMYVYAHEEGAAAINKYIK